MNEKLKELDQQAVDYAVSVCDANGYFDGKEYLQVVKEKFADLIIHTCMWEILKDDVVPKDIKVLIGDRFKNQFGFYKETFKIKNLSIFSEPINFTYFNFQILAQIRFKWATVDSAGMLYVHEDEPYIVEDWWVSNRETEILGSIEFEGDWKESKQELIVSTSELLRLAFEKSFLKNCFEVNGDEVYLRYETPDSDSQEQWDNYTEVVDELKKCGWEFVSEEDNKPLVEHDCISGYIQKIANTD